MSSIAVFVGACGDSDGLKLVSPLPEQGEHTPHTGIEQGIWPPQPLGISNQEPLPASARESARGLVINSARSTVLNNPNIRTALGDEYIEFEGSMGDAKGTVSASFLFFSYSANQTIEVNLLRSGDVSHVVYAPEEFQPTEHQSEVERAIALANTALTSAGFETAGLQGTAMLAFPRASDSTDNGQQFYSQRLMYVTFGVGNGELPTYSALVNLSTEEVTEAGLIQ